MSVDYAKLKTNLNLIMHRLKLVEKKKMELNQKARRTIGEFLNGGKVDRARIRVEQIIREDYIVEAMDLVESYCDLILSRFGQLQATETVDEGLATAISSLIWVTPYFESDVPELKTISEQLGRKYGKQYVAASRENQLKTVNETLMKKMSVQVPPKVLVEKYLVEIAKDQKIDYKADPKIIKEQEILDQTRRQQAPNNSSDDDDGGDLRVGGGSRQPSQAPSGGFNLIDLGDHYPRNPITAPFSPYGQPPPLPSEPPLGGPVVTGPAAPNTDALDASAPSARIPIGFNLSLDSSSSSSAAGLSHTMTDKSASIKPLHTAEGSSSNSQAGAEGGPPPHYDSIVVNKPSSNSNQTQYFSFGQHNQSAEDLSDTLPELPPVPKDSTGDSAAGPPPSTTSLNDSNLDFEDLTRRFEELKNKKN